MALKLQIAGAGGCPSLSVLPVIPAGVLWFGFGTILAFGHSLSILAVATRWIGIAEAFAAKLHERSRRLGATANRSQRAGCEFSTFGPPVATPEHQGRQELPAFDSAGLRGRQRLARPLVSYFVRFNFVARRPCQGTTASELVAAWLGWRCHVFAFPG